MYIVFSHFSRKRPPFLQMAAKRMTLEETSPRQSLKTFMLALQKVKPNPNRSQISRDIASYVCCLQPFFTKKAAIFPNGGQTNNFRRNIPQTKFKDLFVSFTKSQTKSKSESDQQRYSELCILSLAIFHEKGSHFSKWRPNE